MKVTRIDFLELSTWEDIVKLLLPDNEQALMKKDIETFMNRKHGVPSSVLKAVLIKAIITAKRTHGLNTIINETYLRITFESFVLNDKRKIVIRNAAQAISKLEKEFDDLRQNNIITKVRKSPEWVFEYLQELENRDSEIPSANQMAKEYLNELEQRQIKN